MVEKLKNPKSEIALHTPVSRRPLQRTDHNIAAYPGGRARELRSRAVFWGAGWGLYLIVSFHKHFLIELIIILLHVSGEGGSGKEGVGRGREGTGEAGKGKEAERHGGARGRIKGNQRGRGVFTLSLVSTNTSSKN